MNVPIRVSTLNALRDEATRISNEHGFTLESATAVERIALIHSEASEALEEIRAGRPLSLHYYSRDGKTYDGFRCPNDGSPNKPEGVPAEIADVIIRCLDFCGKHEIDIDRAVLEKLEYNATRPFKHGKVI